MGRRGHQVRVDYIEVQGFRSFGTESQRIEFNSKLAIIHADNSQGKTSLAEAVEFLLAGTISRRQLGGGSPAEFQDSLRNAHLSDGSVVYVAVGLSEDDGASHVLRRSLTSDYQGAGECSSQLTLDGSPIQTVEEAGLFLSDPPLQAPVLLEHSLRYAVSAKPGERSDYFKAVVEVADLDLVRAEIATLVAERESLVVDPLITRATSLALASPFSVTQHLERSQSFQDVELALLSALNALVPPSADEISGIDPLPGAIARVSMALDRRRRSVIPVGDMRVPDAIQANRTLNGETSVALVDEYNRLLAAVDRAVAETIPLLKAALGLQSASSVEPGHPIDCPLCETSQALTSERVAAMTSQVAEREGLTAASDSLVAALNHDLEVLAQLSREARRDVPLSAGWGPEAMAAHASTFAALGADESSLFEAVTSASELSNAAAVVEEVAERLRALLGASVERVSAFESIEVDFRDELLGALGSLDAALTNHKQKRDSASSSSETALGVIEAKLAQQTDTEGWESLLQLAAEPQAIWDAYVGKRSRDAVTARLKSAQRQIDTAVRVVLDRKLRLMADSVRKWWSLMRPGELTAFENIARRGAGNRFLDLTATLVPDEAGAGVSRNALAVLSNSQLNALGLATFLARCELLGSPIVLLDDPVPGSDREHRFTFAGPVVEALLQGGRQVIITTHDAELARSIHTLHQHHGIDEYNAALVDPRQGTRVTRSGDDFEHLMLTAKSQMGSPLEENRRAAGNSLRIAAERLAKHILVDARVKAGDADAALENYDNKNLSTLRPLVLAHVMKANEPGQWQTLARVLNDADHDAPPPQPADLKVAHDMLRDIKKSHGVSTASSAGATTD
ncbi:MAG TPA: AAA family ATPase [Microthrixaceae bacterium]|nr:AAA family ATPase [Microthrixaceae bacterium]